MKKKIIIGVGVLFVGVLAVLIIGRFVPQAEEEMLVYGNGGKLEIVVDLAVQGSSQILYIQKIKLIVDNPTLGDVIQAVGTDNSGIDIRINESGELTQIEDQPNNSEGHWGILIENKPIEEKNVWNIPVENYQGLTFLYQ